MFHQYLEKNDIKELLVRRTEYHPFPKACEREAWENLLPELRQAIGDQGEKYLDIQWPSVPAVRFMDFKRDGNRSRYEALHFQRRRALESLVLAECAEGRNRFIDDIINGIWCICEESFWGVPAHNSSSKYKNAPLPDTSEPIIDLFAAETSDLLAWTYYLLKDQLDEVSPLICERISREIKYRILDPFIERNDFWWMGFNPDRKVNNWNPWINSNCIASFLIMEKDEERRNKGIIKAMESLDNFIAVYHPDGGCDEGTSYWDRAGASLFDCLELLYGASEGKINFYSEPLVKEIGRFIYKAYIGNKYFINFADGGAKVNIAKDLVYRYGKRIEDPLLMAMGSSAFHLDKESKISSSSLLRKLPEIFDYDRLKNGEKEAPYIRDSWLNGIQVMAAREKEATVKGLYLAAKGGHNNESHNHNDIGQFIVYADGEPAIIDIGVETYTAKTFSSQRYEIWTMQSAYHNLPTINGVQQHAGEEYRASEVSYQVCEDFSKLSMNISDAYPKEAGLEYWKREFKLSRKEKAYVEIKDSFKLKKESEDLVLTLMTPYEPEFYETGKISLKNSSPLGVTVEFDGEKFNASGEKIQIQDGRLHSVWGDGLYRITLKIKKSVAEDSWLLKIYQ